MTNKRAKNCCGLETWHLNAACDAGFSFAVKGIIGTNDKKKLNSICRLDANASKFISWFWWFSVVMWEEQVEKC